MKPLVPFWKKLHIHPLLIPFVFGFYFTGKGRLFLSFFCFVTIHECCHCVAAKAFGGRIQKFMITPVGERAILENIMDLSYGKRQLILLAGPFSNFLLMGIFFVLGRNNPLFWEYGWVNFVLWVFNLFPFFPLDGGRLLHFYLGERRGYLKTAKAMVKISRVFGYSLILWGLLQVVFSPYEISFLVIGFYFVYANKREFLHITYQTYHIFASERKKNLPVAVHYVKEEKTIGALVEELNLEQYHFYLRKVGGELFVKSQEELMKDLLQYGNTTLVFAVPWGKEWVTENL